MSLYSKARYGGGAATQHGWRGRFSPRWIRVLAGVLVAGFTIGAAAEESMPRAGRLYVSPMAAWQQFPDDTHEDSDVGPGLALGYGFSERWMAEILHMQFEPDYSLPGGSGSDDVDTTWINVLYKIETDTRWQPFATLGYGRSEIEFDELGDIDDNQVNAGLGVFGRLSDRFAVRGDVRGVYSNEQDTIEPFASIGLTAVLGRITPSAPRDSDGDGVPDSRDQCPGTPAGRTVDANGCEPDRDGDGVPDSVDQCPNTPRGDTVDSRGCSPDGDADGDGVRDSADRCPETPAGVEVDSRGCALDSDGDGVPDYRDDCPDSDRGARVDDRGCYIELEETVTIDLNLEFDTNSSDLRPDHAAEIQRVIDFLREYPTANAVIEGHTDSDGAESYNQSLSERRARSVYDYLVDEGNVAANRLSHAGFGESRPIADNGTREGKQRNRRVSAVISGTHTVRQ